MKLLNLDHVGIAVTDLDRAIEGYQTRYGVVPLYREVVEAQGVEEAMIPVGGSFVQLLQPRAADTPVGKFLARRGQGLHHIAYTVASIGAALDHLKGQGARLIDETPRIGGRGAQVAFVHPDDLGGTLIELVEPADG
ncbi:MAG TPA: methylmalonyl-CoA epimerase [Acidimicrobiia bacterium]|jgi:methylmalonyl-CoA/ethylmalonyl-CoA epimerase|nr:methylmalonyl-CoA epimerase [Acidimicrobiia bacterium]